MPRDSDVNKENWWEIWAAGVAVHSKCISNGWKGTAVNLGESYRYHWDAQFILYAINELMADWLL